MNDLYKSPNGKCLEKFEFVKKFELIAGRKAYYTTILTVTQTPVGN